MNLFFFNYSHDLALANGSSNYILPRHVRMMEHDLMPMAAFCAEKGDAIAVDESLTKTCTEFYKPLCNDIEFVSTTTLPADKRQLRPWGIDFRLERILQKAGLPYPFTSKDIEHLHRLSSRIVASELLHSLRTALPHLPLCGESTACYTEAQVAQVVSFHPSTLLKAPWSGSGRGLRFASRTIEPPLTGWCRNILQAQGALMVEPIYNKVTDIAVEFMAEPSGQINYLGLSLFRTTDRCTYLGNTIAPQAVLEQEAFGEIGIGVLHEVTDHIGRLLETTIDRHYTGPLGVDMMICRDKDGLKLHPCVEINFRNTMGILALHLERFVSNRCTGIFQMRYEHTETALQTYAAALPTPRFDSDGKLCQGCLLLTPILADTRYIAWLSV